MKPGHPVCERCPHAKGVKNRPPLGIHCPEGPEPMVTMEIPLIGQISRRVKPDGEDYECARSTCASGVRMTRWAWNAARKIDPVEEWMRVKGDGAVEFLNEGKRRRVYPDGTVMVLVKREWQEIGKITPSDSE
jgi:hypothetical protein